jgi:hypothetical protein
MESQAPGGLLFRGDVKNPFFIVMSGIIRRCILKRPIRLMRAGRILGAFSTKDKGGDQESQNENIFH